MSDIVLLFSGQGAQKVGMGRDFAEHSAMCREMAVKADQALGFAISEVMFDGPDEELTKTSRCQPALYLHGLMALALIRERLPDLTPVAAANPHFPFLQSSPPTLLKLRRPRRLRQAGRSDPMALSGASRRKQITNARLRRVKDSSSA
jgi:hypothetical protein